MQTLLTHALGLHQLGYIPLQVPYATKAAKQAGWQVMLPTEDSIARDFSRPSNLGVRCGDLRADGTRLMAIDVDVENGEVIRCIDKAIGQNVPTKSGKKGATYFVRVDYEQKSTKFKLNRDGVKTPAIDILCVGAQTVIPPSIHPDTQLPYRWVTGKPLWEVEYRTLR